MLRDFYGEFQRRTVTCHHCDWSGPGADMKSGDAFAHGVDKHCPKCGERYGLVHYSTAVGDAPDDLPANNSNPIAD